MVTPIELTYRLELNANETKRLYKAPRSLLRPGVPESSIHAMMKDMVMNVLMGRPFIPKRGNGLWLLFPTAILILAAVIFCAAWVQDAPALRPFKRSVFLTLGSTETKVDTLFDSLYGWSHKDAVSLFHSMRPEDAAEHLTRRLAAVYAEVEWTPSLSNANDAEGAHSTSSQSATPWNTALPASI